jgi:hypothetical protein
MAVHFTIYPEQPTADALRCFMAAHTCSVTTAVELLLAFYATESRGPGGAPRQGIPDHPRRVARAGAGSNALH